MLLVLFEDIEAQRKLLHVQEGEVLSWISLEKLLDLTNRAECHLQELETRIHMSPFKF
jgi:hypothetical protein